MRSHRKQRERERERAPRRLAIPHQTDKFNKGLLYWSGAGRQSIHVFIPSNSDKTAGQYKLCAINLYSACGILMWSFRLRFFGHLARSAPEEDHHRVIATALRPPTDWGRPVKRPRTTWLRTIDEDVQPQNFGAHTAWRKARDRDTWQQVVSTATLC